VVRIASGGAVVVRIVRTSVAADQGDVLIDGHDGRRSGHVVVKNGAAAANGGGQAQALVADQEAVLGAGPVEVDVSLAHVDGVVSASCGSNAAAVVAKPQAFSATPSASAVLHFKHASEVLVGDELESGAEALINGDSLLVGRSATEEVLTGEDSINLPVSGRFDISRVGGGGAHGEASQQRQGKRESLFHCFLPLL